ncbi:MAG TPA: hypothetical protein VGM90_03515 [Kofleriaceae bacterium]|jgi:hypothetical protein
MLGLIVSWLLVVVFWYAVVRAVVAYYALVEGSRTRRCPRCGVPLYSVPPEDTPIDVPLLTRDYCACGWSEPLPN